MKKLLLVFGTAFALAFTTKAQITILSTNSPTAGHIFVQAEDTVYTGVSVGNAGANQTWNFSNWVKQKEDTTAFVAPNNLTGASYFPGANLGIISGGVTEFANASSTAFNILGAYEKLSGSSYIPSVINPYLELISFPSTYLTKYSGSYSNELKMAYNYPPYDSLELSTVVTYSSNIDGWGTITTPASSNVPCLRQYVMQINTSSSYVHTGNTWTALGSPSTDTTYEYRWWSNTANFFVAHVNLDHISAVTNVNWFLSYTVGSSGIAENTVTQNEIKVFPNPASKEIHITGISEASAIVISDMTGKLVNGSILHNTNNTVDISYFKNGIYIYQILDLNSNTLSKGKFIITK